MFAQHALGRALYSQGDFTGALVRFRAAQVLPDSLGAGLWNEVLLVPHQFYEAMCLQKLGEATKAQEIFSHILKLKADYFSSMHLPELSCWQAKVYLETGREAMTGELLAAHERIYGSAREVRDAGYFKSTPFFISYQEPAQVLRKAACDWQLAMVCFAAGELSKARELAAASLKGEPTNLYARLLLHE
jgi:tetratricopeptide (TPR) repeat protein